MNTDHMTATDELRRLLDERGVEWWPMHDVDGNYHEDRDTEFVIDGRKYTAHEWGYGLTVYGLTPEQAVEATLGRAYEPPVAAHWDGDVLILTTPRDPSSIHVQRSESQPRKVYAEETKVIAATLGRGECDMERSWRGETEAVEFHCLACDEYALVEIAKLDGTFDAPRYCPNCGRKVVGE